MCTARIWNSITNKTYTAEQHGVYVQECAARRLCAVRRWEPKEVEDLLAGPSQRPGRSGAQSDPGDAGEGGKQR